jgi:hypothetical protein
MEIYKVKIKGTKPLLMHAPIGIGNKPTRRRGEHLQAEKEAELYLYKDDQGNICIPAMNLKACLREAGRNYRVSGRKTTFAALIRAGLEIEPEMVPLIHNGWEVDTRSVVVQRQRIPRSRPRFDSWELEFVVKNNDPNMLSKDILEQIVIDAGRYYGVGDFRPEFGLFKLEKFE